MGRIKKLIALYAQADLTAAVTRKFHKWLLRHADKAETDEALAILWEDSAGATGDVADAYSRFCDRAGIATSANTKYRLHLLPGSNISWRGIAATIAWGLSIASTYWIVSERYDEGYVTEVTAAYGEIREVELPDGSVVQLNSGSTLLFPGKFKKEVRSVYLFGEAVFSVKSDSIHPFTVKASGIDITATGTRFNVCAYPNQRKVTAALIEGKIQVDCEKTEQVFKLTPGQRLVYDDVKSTMVVEEVDIDDIVAWREEQLIFHGATVFEIFDAIERRYNLTIQYSRQDFNDDKYNVRFKSKASLQDMLDILQKVIGDMQYELDNTHTLPHIIVTRN
ncbi:MAG: FecR domain-containing protein [Bacteroidales bacterium]